MNDLAKRLDEGPLLCAEGYLYELERRGYLQAGPFVPIVVLEEPEVLRQLHRDFLRAGSDIMEALTYYGNRDKLKVIGRSDALEELNRQAVRIAKDVASEVEGTLVAGNICNVWDYDPDDSATHEHVRAIYEEQVQWAAEEGVDFIIAETLSHVGEAKLALEVIQAHDLPSVVTYNPLKDKTFDGYEFVTACEIAANLGADVVGMNCSRGPATLMPILREIRDRVSCHVAALPSPFATDAAHPTFASFVTRGNENPFPVYLDPYACARDTMAAFAVEATDLGINYIGLCCGAGPHHIRSMAEALGRHPPASKFSPRLDLLASSDELQLGFS